MKQDGGQRGNAVRRAEASSARVLAAIDLRAKHDRQLAAEQRAAAYFIAPAVPARATMHIELHSLLLVSRRDPKGPAISLLALRTEDRERPTRKRFGHLPILRNEGRQICMVANNRKAVRHARRHRRLSIAWTAERKHDEHDRNRTFS
jgi:hypothetical protein